MTTDLPVPMLAAQSPGRAEVKPVGGGGGFGAGGGGFPSPGAAEEEPQAATPVLMPRAAIARSMADPPTALPSDVRNSRRAIFVSGVRIFLFRLTYRSSTRRAG
jgi:hypothetical protein